jgi:hypothetical protein
MPIWAIYIYIPLKEVWFSLPYIYLFWFLEKNGQGKKDGVIGTLKSKTLAERIETHYKIIENKRVRKYVPGGEKLDRLGNSEGKKSRDQWIIRQSWLRRR